MLRSLLTLAILLASLPLISLDSSQSVTAEAGTPLMLSANVAAYQMITDVEEGNSIGSHVAAGDIEGDSATDLVLTGRVSRDTSGRVQLYCCNEDGSDIRPVWTLDGKKPGDNLSGAKPAVVDRNGEGHDDIALGALGIDGNTVAACIWCVGKRTAGVLR